jgi:hypothetical protein
MSTDLPGFDDIVSLWSLELADGSPREMCFDTETG